MIRFIGFLLAIFAISPAWGEIAVVHSYHEDLGWVKEVNNGISTYLRKRSLFQIKPYADAPNPFKYFYMDAKRHQSDVAYLKQRGQEIIEELKKHKIKYVLVSDDEALKYVAAPLKNDPHFKFIFVGVNNDPKDYGVVTNFKSPEFNISGIVSEHPFDYSLKLLKDIFPGKVNVHPLFDDSVSSRGILQDLLDSRTKDDNLVIKKAFVSNDWSQWKEYIRKNQGKGNVFIVGTLYSIRNSKGEMLTENQINKWIIANSKVPDFGVLTSQVKDGLLLTISNPGFVHGYEGFHKLMQVKKGTPVNRIPIQSTRQKALHVNIERAKQLGVEIPLEVIVLSRHYDEIGY
ncbi:MAG: hypothetical protein CL677_09810 [Bdellovibrionaceae bacterium]|nr:hypothetical protein [Pseudobdellovibrionaceae bacterium]|tara:strand:+ start:32432 stop:33466 length:1035 start_codon:yes stop_codon:yes gene_type:complete